MSAAAGRRAWLAWAAVTAAGFTLTGIAHGTEPPADLVLLHGRIHTQDPSRSVVQAIAVRGNRIVAVGSDQAVSALIGPSTRSVDLSGKLVLPGIIDAHTHPAESALDFGKCSLEDEELTPVQIKARVAQCLKEHPGDGTSWFEVIKANPSGLTLTLADLDAMLADRPLLINTTDAHSLWANSAALAAAHISASTQDPAGGRIEHDAAGNPTGTLRDQATYLATDARPAGNLDVEASQLEQALGAMRAAGITSVQDARVDAHYMSMYKRLYDTHRLDMRVRASFGLINTERPSEVLIGEAIRFRAAWNIDPEFLRADAIKIYADGAIEYPGQTAALLEPYLDAAGRPTRHRGRLRYTPDHLNRVVSAADAAGFTVHVHAIGDRAVRAALDAFAQARRRNGAQDNRDQIAHLELVDPKDFSRFKQLGVIANMQLLWAQRDSYSTTATMPYIGPERSRHLYPARSLRDSGALLAGGSDWGVSSFNPFEAMEHAITRREARGKEPLLPEQGISLEDMVDAYTIHAAFALKQERITGSLEPGKRADFIVLDRDIFAIDPYDLHDTRVLSTYLDGREVYAAKP